MRGTRRGFALALLAGPALAQGFSEAQRAEIVEILRRALREDPSILRDAFQALEQNAAAERSAAQRMAVIENLDALFRNSEDAVRGNPRGDVTIVEFFDLRCPYCKRLHTDMQALLAADRNVRIVMKDLPILGPQSVVAARALIAAQRQGRYAEFHDALMRLRGEPTDAALRTEAQRVGLDWSRLSRDMEDPVIARRIERNLELARRLAIEGTPALVIGEQVLPGAVDLATLQALVERQRRG